MATTHIAFCKIGTNYNGTGIPIVDGESVTSEAITPSGSNQQSSAAPESIPFVCITTDANVYVALGANPDATTATGRFLMLANTERYFRLTKGNKVAVVTASL